jgi:hypothetical protein
MNKIYMIRQLSSKEINDNMIYENDIDFYYASEDLEKIENIIKFNWSDLYETLYSYIALVTVNLNSIGAVHDPIRIFEYQKETNTYKEVGYFNMLVSNESDLGFKKKKEE